MEGIEPEVAHAEAGAIGLRALRRGLRPAVFPTFVFDLQVASVPKEENSLVEFGVGYVADSLCGRALCLGERIQFDLKGGVLGG